MREFVRGWRRKVGMASLCSALLMMSTWIRSQIVYDQLEFGVAYRQFIVISIGGRIYWDYRLHESPHFGRRSGSLSYDNQASSIVNDLDNRLSVKPLSDEHFRGAFSYLHAVIVVTMFSTILLLLGKPKSKPHPATSESSSV
jgi:hypothetical protein